MRKIYYKEGYKYQLTRSYFIQLDIDVSFVSTHFHCDRGFLNINKGYAWDGPSGPTIDTKNFLRASLVHDVLYQAMREGILDEQYRLYADKKLRDICEEDGMSSFRAGYVYSAVRALGEKFCKCTNDECSAP